MRPRCRVERWGRTGGQVGSARCGGEGASCAVMCNMPHTKLENAELLCTCKRPRTWQSVCSSYGKGSGQGNKRGVLLLASVCTLMRLPAVCGCGCWPGGCPAHRARGVPAHRARWGPADGAVGRGGVLQLVHSMRGRRAVHMDSADRVARVGSRRGPWAELTRRAACAGVAAHDERHQVLQHPVAAQQRPVQRSVRGAA